MTTSEYEFTIMCFSWNAAGLRLCSSLATPKKGLFSRGPSCVTPNFFQEINRLITDKKPSLVVMSTQDEDVSNTYFHAEFLAKEMPPLGYQLLQRDKLDGIGETASGNPFEPKDIPSGKPSGSALRMSIYANNSVFAGLQIQEKKITDFFSSKKIPRTFKCAQNNNVAGAIVAYVTQPIYQKIIGPDGKPVPVKDTSGNQVTRRFAFINAHFPAGAAGAELIRQQATPGAFEHYRQGVIAKNNFCLHELQTKFLQSIPDPNMKPQHIFLMGDLGYDIKIDGGGADPSKIIEWTKGLDAGKIKQLQTWDDLNLVKTSGVLNGFHEGVDNNGPYFAPTWRMKRGRSVACTDGNIGSGSTAGDLSTCFAPGKELAGFGWHDRILYRDMDTQAVAKTHCLTYNRMDVLNMHDSTHAGVLATFEMKAST